MAADDADQQVQKKSFSQRWDETCKTIWNKDKGEFLGRTGVSWAKIGLFYLIFYSCLAGFFAIMLTAFFTTLSDDHPKQTGLFSLIKSNPGMGFRPMIDIDSTLIKFDSDKPKTYEDHLENIEELLKKYDDQSDAEPCDPTHRPDKDSKVCEFNLKKEFGSRCTKANAYGFSKGKPCILVKINKVYGWKPEPFSDEALNDTDNEMAQQAHKLLGSRLNDSYIGVTCEGENDGDKDNIINTTYYPDLGYSYAYFPYYNTKGYLAPLVFVQFEVRRGALIQVWCKLWVSNIKHHKNDKAGSTHFELLVD